MKKRFILLLILPLFVLPLFADEYEDVYDLIVPESFTFLTIDGGLWNVGGTSSQLNYNENIIELNLGSNTFSLDVQGDADYRYYNQNETTELNIIANGDLRLGTITTGLSTFLNTSYLSYDLDISGMPGFWLVGGTANINAFTSSLTYNFRPAAAVGVGRVFSIYNVYRAKLMMENLGITPTVEKVEKVVSIFQKFNEINNRFTNDTTELDKEYYQSLADAMGIGDRSIDVLILDIWNSQKYAYERAKFIGMKNGWDARFVLSAEYNKNFAGSSLSIEGGPEAQIGGFLMNNMLYYDANAQAKVQYTLNGSVDFTINTNARGVYLFDDYRMWAEAIVDINYSHGSLSPFNLEISGAGYYLINNNFRVYAGLRLEDSPNLYMFAGGQIRLW